MKRKKLWIVLSVICAIILTVSLVFGLLFRLKVVDVEFVSRESIEKTHLENGIIEKVKTDGEFKFGKNILFLKLDDSIAKIEKKNPYIKVTQTIKSFPNIVRVYITERLPQYRVKDQGSENWYILDVDFKVLDIVQTANLRDEFFETTVEVAPETLILLGLERGDFATVENQYDEYLNWICDGIYGRNEDAASAYSIQISTNAQGELSFTITMRNASREDGRGCKILIEGLTDLSEKVYAGISAFEEDIKGNVDLNTPDSTIEIIKTGGEYRGVKK